MYDKRRSGTTQSHHGPVSQRGPGRKQVLGLATVGRHSVAGSTPGILRAQDKHALQSEVSLNHRIC